MADRRPSMIMTSRLPDAPKLPAKKKPKVWVLKDKNGDELARFKSTTIGGAATMALEQMDVRLEEVK